MIKKLKKIYIGFIIGILASLGVSLFTTNFFSDLFNKFENFSYDMRYKWKYDPTTPGADVEKLFNWQACEDVVICDIDERSMTKYGVYHKWRRSYHGDLVKVLAEDGAAVTGFDIIFGGADFGKKDISIAKKALQEMGFQTGEHHQDILKSYYDYDGQFCAGVKTAGNVIAGMLLTDTVDYIFTKDWKEKSTEAWRRANNPASGAKLPESISQAFHSTIVYTSDGGMVGTDKLALDNIFPELSSAASRIGFVNVVPDGDGVHRDVPLLFNFRGYTYPTLSLQMVLYLFDKKLGETEIIPGEHINIGKPFSIRKDTTGTLCVSYPSVTLSMVEKLLEEKSSVLSLKPGDEKVISSYMKFRRGDTGGPYLELISGEMPMAVVRELHAFPADSFANLSFDEPVRLGKNALITRYDDGRFDVTQMDRGGEEIEWFEGNHPVVFEFLKKAPLMEIEKMGKNTSRLLAMDLTVTWKDGDLRTQCPVLRGKALRELLTMDPKDLSLIKKGERLSFGDEIKIPIDENGRHIITYMGPRKKALKFVSYYDVREKRIGAHYFQHKAVVLGSSAAALFDIVTSPFSSDYPGVELQGTLLAGFMKGEFIRKLDKKREWVILLGLGIIMGLIAYLLRPLWAGILGVFLVMGHFLFGMVMFDDMIWIEIIRPILSIILTYISVVGYQYVTEEKDRKFLHDTFKQYLTPALIDQMYENKQMPSLGGEEGIRTAYFTDIQSFSTFSEKLGSPAKLVELLNEYLSAMTDILLAEQGTLDKYEGDAIIAFFGAPMPLEDHATRACITALKMQSKLLELREKWQSEGDKWPKIVHNMRMRIGVNSGPIVTGNMGSAVRMNYTMMGDAVNLAARLESGAKQYGVYTLCSQETLDMTDGSIITRQVDLLRVMGKSEPVAIHEILCLKDEVDEKMSKLLDAFSKGYLAYREMKWDAAASFFDQSLELEPFYGQPGVVTCPSIVMKERCADYKENPPVEPGEKWDGVYTATSK